MSEHQLKAAGSSARTTTLACASCQTFLQGALHYLNILHVHTALWLKYGPICTPIPCLVRINFRTNSLDCFIDAWLVMFAARPDLCWIITATFDSIVGLKNKGGNSWDRCAPLRCILECKKIRRSSPMKTSTSYAVWAARARMNWPSQQCFMLISSSVWFRDRKLV